MQRLAYYQNSLPPISNDMKLHFTGWLWDSGKGFPLSPLWNTTSWRFYAPTTGYYSVMCRCHIDILVANSQSSGQIRFYVNDTTPVYSSPMSPAARNVYAGTTQSVLNPMGITTVHLNAGDFMSFYLHYYLAEADLSGWSFFTGQEYSRLDIYRVPDSMIN